MLLRPNPSSGVPIYLQLMEQVKHSIETGALRPGEQLPGIRPLAEELVINPNTVAKAYRELEHEGVIELRHGAGAFVSSSGRAKKTTDTALSGGYRSTFRGSGLESVQFIGRSCCLKDSSACRRSVSSDPGSA